MYVSFIYISMFIYRVFCLALKSLSTSQISSRGRRCAYKPILCMNTCMYI